MESRGLEIEAKYRLRPGQRQALETFLAPYPYQRLVQEDQYYDVGERVLRLRWEEGKWLLTYKDKPQVTPQGVKVRREVEAPIPANFVPELDALLVWLGHRRLGRVRKTRDVYWVDGLTVTLDRIEGLPDDYAELEITDRAPGGAQRLAELRKRLGLREEQVELRSYARLVAEARGEEVLGRE